MRKEVMESPIQAIGAETGIIIPISREGLYVLVNDAVNNAVEKLANQKPQPLKTKLRGFRNASKAVGVGVNTLMKLRDEEKIRCYNIGSNYFFYEEELLQDLESLKRR